MSALHQVISESAGRSSSELYSIGKLAEGGFNRVLQATFRDGFQVLARLPYPMVSAKSRTVASEVATLTFLRMKGLPVQNVLGYSTTCDNRVGAEYILMEKIQGTSLGLQWYDMSNGSRKRIIEQVVAFEKSLMSVQFPASGSLYHRRDLEADDECVHVAGTPATPDEIVIGPTAQHEWHYKERINITEHSGPWHSFQECFEAVAKHEILWCKQYGRPRLHVERYLRELHNLKAQDPNIYTQMLESYLKLAPSLALPFDHPLSRPVLRHPDFSPNNILVSETGEILGIIDWQFAVVLPLCLAAGIPKYFQNWGDPHSERMTRPETELPPGFTQLPPNEQASIRDTQRRRLTHFLYAAGVMVDIPEHFYAMTQQSAMLRARLYNLASAPWEGDSISLKRALIEAREKWPLSLGQDGADKTSSSAGECPIGFTPEETRQCLDEYQRQEEELEELRSMRDHLDVDPQGWVPDDDHWNKSRHMAQRIKSAMLEHVVKSDMTKRAVEEHFPFDDHDEE